MIRRVKVKRVTREILRSHQLKGESVDDAVNRILDVVIDDLGDDSLFISGHTSIDLDDSTMERLKSSSIYMNEPYDNIIARALSLYMSMF